MQNVIQNKNSIFIFKKKNIDHLRKLAKKSKNLRSRICIHLSTNAKVQEMMIFALKNSYMPPHKHPPGNTESYHIISGELDLFIFNEKGKIINKINLQTYNKKTGAKFYYRTSSGDFWHMPVVKSRECVFHEIYSGPFKKTYDVKFPKWAPNENDQIEIPFFFKKLRMFKSDRRKVLDKFFHK